jgi:hypothetical protein
MPTTRLLTQAAVTLGGSALLSLALYLFLSGRAKAGHSEGSGRRLSLKAVGPTALCGLLGVVVLVCGLWTVSDETQQEPERPAEMEKVKRRFLRQYHARTTTGLSVGAVLGLSSCEAVGPYAGAAGLAHILPQYEPVEVNLADLLQDPARYDGLLVRVRATLRGKAQKLNEIPPVLRSDFAAGGQHLLLIYRNPNDRKAAWGQLTVTGIFHDDETAWLEAFPESGGRIEPAREGGPGRR